jgi:beta-lactamase superfamily II metal-dependent hydrolase
MSVFAGYPAPFVFDETRRKKIQQLIWGDYVSVTQTDAAAEGWVNVHARNADGWMRTEDIHEQRLLELNFIDVGQGDSCLIVTPDDEYLLIDAGQADNLWWFLRWRFNLQAAPDRMIRIQHAVITHPDADHYGGFTPLFVSKQKQIHITNLWHNGIIVRATEPHLGPATGSPTGGSLTDVIETHSALVTLLRDDAVAGRAGYAALLRAALKDNQVDTTAMASTELGYLPGYGPEDRMSLRVLGPAPIRAGDALQLPRLGDDGKTKNGNSVVLRLQYGNVRVLLGGDLNSAAERHLIAHHTAAAGDQAEQERQARETFAVDIAKTCHHGSADFLDKFLAYQQPAAWVISSGDSEPYSHPRPDTLGALGRNGRGERPLIFSTELARSPAEAANRPEHLRARDAKVIEDGVAETTAKGASAAEQPGVARYQRAIAVYGMITVRTDGTKVLISTKLERPRAGGQEWDYYCLEPDAGGVLHHVRN